MAVSFNTQMADLAQEWAIENGVEEIDIDKVYEWATSTGKYQRKPISLKQQFKAEMRKALAQQTHIDPQGRKIRTRKPVKLDWLGEQLTLWIDVRTAKPAIAEKAFQRDYEGIKNDVKRQSVEMQSYDDNNRYGATLPLFDYDFNQVAADARMTGEYDDSYDDDDLDDLD
jgi:hypothetical protein